jgi:hypothetical protein
MQEMAYAVEDFGVGAWPYVEYGARILYENGHRTRRVVDVAEGAQCGRGRLAGVLHTAAVRTHQWLYMWRCVCKLDRLPGIGQGDHFLTRAPILPAWMVSAVRR